VLVTVAEMFTEHIKEQGCAIRWGGEEFLLIYQKDEKDALAELETLQKELEDYIFEYEEHRFRVTMTFGLVQYMPGQTIDELVKAADDLLYLGKEGGRNRIIFREEQEN
jgi:diguanylate cyclase (GGDEF)-like protein